MFERLSADRAQKFGANFDALQSLGEGYIEAAAKKQDANQFWIGGFGGAGKVEERQGRNDATMLANAAKFKALTGRDIREFYQIGDEDIPTAASRGASALARLSMGRSDPFNAIGMEFSGGRSGGGFGGF